MGLRVAHAGISAESALAGAGDGGATRASTISTSPAPPDTGVAGEPSVRAARVVGSLVDISTALAAYLIARRLGRQRWALVAAGLVAFNPFLIYFSALLLTETLFTAMPVAV